MNSIQAGILIVSDRSSSGERADATLPLLTPELNRLGWEVKITGIVPDEMAEISAKLMDWTDHHSLDLILTSGGTGFAPRDITPEATKAVIEKEAPGLCEAMRARSLQTTPHAMLSRAIAGIRKSTIIINLPGNPKGALENLQVISIVLPHAVELLRNSSSSDAGHHPH